ncbi:ATP-binding cassette domain-containing protein [Streptomyces sp. J2-1]|uniref:ATP-binding cassette domain-containing protein n=1 Tax=Streptomyces corallincola TaxID=2851888 RepID=UPI001C3857C4|nr:ATP-binding cassette domain-containing protein [Streptomyces corallincola]MBV2357027.1 ATP-binding cassette domain-containing protein [Streptomyces corallincola]
MIEAFGLTSIPRKAHLSALDDLSFEARAGQVTVLLGASGAGKTTALRLMLELQQGRGVTHFRGRPLHHMPHPAHEVGVLLGDVPGHPARSVRGHLRMLCAAAGVSARRADEMLEAVGLVSFREERLGTLARGLDRRLGLACALLTDPHTLVLDAPTEGLSPREARWLHGMLRAHAAQGGTVLCTTADSKEAARNADRVVSLDAGRLVADQEAGDFARTRLRPRVAVRSPHAARLAALLTKEARVGRRSVEVISEGGNRLSVYGSTTADVGDTAYRHGILVHQLADEVGDAGSRDRRDPRTGSGEHPRDDQARTTTGAGALAPEAKRSSADAERHTAGIEAEAEAGVVGATDTADTGAGRITRPETDRAASAPTTAPEPGTGTAPRSTTAVDTLPAPATVPGARNRATGGTTAPPAPADQNARGDGDGAPDGEAPRPPAPAVAAFALDPASPLPPPIDVRPARSPLRPLRYELRRVSGIGTGFLVCGAALIASVLTAVLLARLGHTPQARLFAAWPAGFPLPPAAFAAGLLGALAFGDEFRHPALAADRGTVPRRLGLLAAKLLVSGATAVLLAFLTLGCDAEVLYLLHGGEMTRIPADWLSATTSWFALVTGCAWAGVLAAGVFRSTTAGLAAVLAVPVVVVPAVHWTLREPAVRMAAGLPERMRELMLLQWPFGGERYLLALLRVVAQPVGWAMSLSLAGLLGAYLFGTLRTRVG